MMSGFLDSDRLEMLIARWNVLAALSMECGELERASAIRQCIDELEEEIEQDQ